MTPTSAGQALLERLRRAFSKVSDAVDAVHCDAKGKGVTLRLNVPSAVADLVLPDIVTRFMAAHPAIIVDITAENDFIDALAEGFDAGIRYDERLERDMLPYRLVCAPLKGF